MFAVGDASFLRPLEALARNVHSWFNESSALSLVEARSGPPWQTRTSVFAYIFCFDVIAEAQNGKHLPLKETITHRNQVNSEEGKQPIEYACHTEIPFWRRFH